MRRAVATAKQMRLALGDGHRNDRNAKGERRYRMAAFMDHSAPQRGGDQRKHQVAGEGPCHGPPESFDHLVGEHDKLIRNCEAECLGGLEIDDEIEFGGLLDRDICWICSSEDLVNQFRGTPKQS